MPKRRDHTRTDAAVTRRVERRLDTALYQSREQTRLEREVLLNDESNQESPIRIPREKRDKSSARDAEHGLSCVESRFGPPVRLKVVHEKRARTYLHAQK